MPIVDKGNRIEIDRYNKFVRNSIYGNVTQDINWARVKKDWISEQVYVEKDGEIVGAMSLLIKKAIGKYCLVYGTRGPVCDINDVDLVLELVEEAEKVVKKYNGFLLRFDPEVNYSKELENLYKEKGYKVRNYGYGKNALIQPRYNMILDMENQDEESLQAKFSKKARYNIRLSKRKGVTCRFGNTDEDVKTFFDLYDIMATRNKIGRRPYEYFINMRDSYENLRIYITEHEGDILSGAVAINYNGKLWYAYGGSSNIKRNFMPNYLMQWEMIKWGIETGAKKYDFGGVFILNNEDGLYKFKNGFCHSDGVTEFIGEIDKVYNPIIYYMFDKLVPVSQDLRKILGKIKKKFRG